MPKLMAAILSSFVAYVPHWLFGDHMSMEVDLVSSTMLGIVSYAAIVWWLGRLRGG